MPIDQSFMLKLASARAEENIEICRQKLEALLDTDVGEYPPEGLKEIRDDIIFCRMMLATRSAEGRKLLEEAAKRGRILTPDEAMGVLAPVLVSARAIGFR